MLQMGAGILRNPSRLFVCPFAGRASLYHKGDRTKVFRNRYPQFICKWHEGTDPPQTVTKVVHVFPDGRVENSYQNLLAKHGGDADKAARELFNDNYTLRREKGDLETKVTEAEKGKAPEGATVLQGDAKQAYEAYLALGKPEEIKTKLDAAATTEAELTTTKRKAAVGELAQTLGWKASVLEDRLDRHPALQWDVKDEAGLKVVTFKEGDVTKPALEFATEKWADFIPALTATTQHRRMHEVNDTGKPADTGAALVDQTLERNKQRAQAPNALRPQPVSAGT